MSDFQCVWVIKTRSFLFAYWLLSSRVFFAVKQNYYNTAKWQAKNEISQHHSLHFRTGRAKHKKHYKRCFCRVFDLTSQYTQNFIFRVFVWLKGENTANYDFIVLLHFALPNNGTHFLVTWRKGNNKTKSTFVVCRR